MSAIANWYIGKNVLITGATGLVGKVLVERLLRDCGEVNCIYLIVRDKNNFDKRCQEFLNNIVFDHLRESNPKQLEKIKILPGDLEQENLGLNSSNLTEILDNIDIVVHSAADVRFDLPLSGILNTNTIGTLRFMELAKRIKKLQISVFVSTTFSQSHAKVTKERYYDAKIDALVLKKALDRFDEQIITALEPKILMEFPNTYSFSKHLAEDIVYRYRNEMPICIVRPSIVTAALKQPIPDYTEGLNGINGWCYASLRGVLRTSYCDPAAPVNIIPVDVVANTIIATSWIHGTKQVEHIEYYNVNTPKKSMKTLLDTTNCGIKSQFEYPLNFSLWSPNSRITKCAYYYYMRTFFSQILPSAILDLLIWLIRNKPIMLRIQRKVYYGLLLVYPYLQSIKFKSDNFMNVPNYLNRMDQEIFDTNLDYLTPDRFSSMTCRGIRKFVAKEKDEDLPKARRNNMIWYWIHIVMQCIVAVYLIRFIFRRVFLDTYIN